MLSKNTVLIIDDDLLNRTLLSKLLSDSYRTIEAGDGAAGLEVLENRSREIACILLDLIMPVMDGATLFDEIHRRHPDLPVVLSSGYAIDDTAKAVLARGCRGFIQKPYSLALLSRQLRLVLDGEGGGERPEN